jgi:asparagine synthase (glutamine-hydrolysing)
MCGISGIVGSRANLATLQHMLKKISHRGEDAYFGECDYGNGYAVGTNRLAIVDSTHGRQPFISEDGNVICISNGEIYNYQELNDYYQKFYNFRSSCDTETILAGYLCDGFDIFEKIRGMYAIFLYDKIHSSWFLGRDHLGIKPIFYAWDSQNNFYFSSELKSFEGLSDISAIEALMPGSVIKNGNIIKERTFYLFSQADDDGSSEKRVLKEVANSLENAVKRMLPKAKEEKVACLLSGGIDSSTVVYLANKLHEGNIEAFTFFNPNSNSNDYESAKLLCDSLGVKLITVSPPTEVLTDFYLKQGVWMTETFECALVRNAVSYYFLCEYVKNNGYKFALSGEGADEIFGGYDYFMSFGKSDRDKAIEISLHDIHRTYLQMADRASMFATLEVRVPYMDEDVTKTVTQLPSQYRINSEINKWALRYLYSEDIPRQIRFRAKTGMNSGAGYGSNDPGESIYYQAIKQFYDLAPQTRKYDYEFAKTKTQQFSPNLDDLEEVYNFCRFWEYGFSRLNGCHRRPQLNTSHLVQF